MNPDGSINWAYIWATLIIRFVGVFIILGVLAVGIYIMTTIAAKVVEIKNKTRPNK
jgi:hypothetical protein